MQLWKRLLVAALAVLAFPASAQQQSRWLRAESPGFIVYGATSELRLRGAAEELQVFDGLLRRMTAITAEPAPLKLTVYLMSEDRFHEVFPDMHDSIVGLYTARIEQTAAFAIYSDASGLGAQDILFHEYAHHFMFQYFANAYPAWYVEGFAEFVATATLGTERVVLGRINEGRFHTLRNATWMPMEQLITAAPLELSTEDAAKFYAQSWLFTHYVFFAPERQQQFLAYVRALRLGQEPSAAFQAGFGMTPDQMQSELRRYLRGAPNAMALTRPATVELSAIEVTRLPASADQLLPLAVRLRHGIAEADRAAVLARTRQLAGAQPSDAFGLATLAYAEATLGENARARDLVTPHLAANPEDAEALYITGMSYLREAEDAEGAARTALLTQARRLFGRVYRNDPNHVPAMYRYIRTYDGEMMDEATATNYLNILLLAHQLSPQIDEISLNAASALMTHNRHAEAIPLLRAVAYDPHGGGGAEAALRMLKEAEAAVEQ